ncbi:MAG: hypothetical protein FVQ82_04000 [Planctomycetes bacterium]|nr:hypothetical protein [Planctomycetota bacterium]
MMTRTNKSVLFVGLFVFTMVFCSVCAADPIDWDKPWDVLTENWWIDYADGDDPNLYPVNWQADIDIDKSYKISFLEESADGKARGMNALKFIHGGIMEGHMVSRDMAGSFSIINTGASNRFTNIFILAAVADDNLGTDFSMSLNLQGQPAYVFDPNHFAFYDGDFGRPSGFYSDTEPNVETITYAHESAMVTVYGVSGMGDPLGYAGDPLYGNTINVEYSFSSLKAPVVFSVYGLAPATGGPEIYHTNRAFIDPNNTRKKVSTFAVTIDADLNKDLKVDLADLAVVSKYWLTGVR